MVFRHGALLVALSTLVTTTAMCQLPSGTDKKACQEQIERFLLNKRLTAKVTFPASSSGINLSLDGEWDHKAVSREIKSSGGGIDIDDPAMVTQVKLKDNLLEVQLNGGGFGTFGDVMLSSEKQRQERSSKGKASGGSRVNLRFGRSIGCESLTDPARMMAFLDPLLNTDALRVAAAQQVIPAEWADAAAKKLAVVGMEKPVVFAILGEPKQKQVDMSSDPPSEKWQYDMADMKTRVVTFKGGKVVKIDEF